MAGIYRDATYPDLVWMEFNGPSWEEFHELFAELEAFNSVSDDGYCLAFYPTIDMPRGAPMTHIRRLMSFLNKEKKIVAMITVLPRHMIFAKAFADLATRMFPGATPSSIVNHRDEVHDAYAKLAEKIRRRA